MLKLGPEQLTREQIEERKKTVYVFKGKIKDLLAELQSEIQKAH